MALTTKQSIYGLVLFAAAGGFIWDRMHSTPAPAAAQADAEPAADANLLVKPAPGSAVHPHRAAPAPKAAAQDAAPATCPTALADRLAAVATANNLDTNKADSAFALQPGWISAKPVEAPTTSNQIDRQEADRKLVEAFRKHHLDAVMMTRRGGYAIVDGQGVFIGQSFSKFTLESVTKTTATFASGDLRVELRLKADQSLTQDGSVIDNAKASVGDDARP